MSAGISWPASTTGAALDATILGLMLAAGGTYVFALVLEMGMTAATSYHIYDDITTSAARFFMPSKTEAEADALVEAFDSGSSTSEEAERWRLTDDDTGFNDLSEMTASMAHVSSVVTLSTSLHGIALLLAVMRMLYSFTFQPRFGIITETLVRSVPGLIDLMVLTSLVLVLLASLAHLVLGDLYDELSTMRRAVHFTFYFLLTGDLGDMKAAVAPFYEGLERNMVSVVVSYIVYSALPLLVGYVLLSFILAVIFESYYDIKFENEAPPSMFDEAGEIVRGRKRLRLLQRGLSAAGIQGQAKPDPPPAEKETPQQQSFADTMNDKDMIVRLSQAIAILTERGIPTKDEERLTKLTSYGRLLAFVAQNEALLLDVSAMVAEVDAMVNMMEATVTNPATMVNAALVRGSGATGERSTGGTRTDEEDSEEAEQAEAAERERMVEELTTFQKSIPAAAGSSKDLFDQLFDMSSTARAVSKRRPRSRQAHDLADDRPGSSQFPYTGPARVSDRGLAHVSDRGLAHVSDRGRPGSTTTTTAFTGGRLGSSRLLNHTRFAQGSDSGRPGSTTAFTTDGGRPGSTTAFPARPRSSRRASSTKTLFVRPAAPENNGRERRTSGLAPSLPVPYVENRPGTALAMMEAARVRRETAAHQIMSNSRTSDSSQQPGQPNEPLLNAPVVAHPRKQRLKSGTRRSSARSFRREVAESASREPRESAPDALREQSAPIVPMWGSSSINLLEKVDDLEEEMLDAGSSASLPSNSRASSNTSRRPKKQLMMLEGDFSGGPPVGPAARIEHPTPLSPIPASPGVFGDPGSARPAPPPWEADRPGSSGSSSQLPEETLPGMPLP